MVQMAEGLEPKRLCSVSRKIEDSASFGLSEIPLKNGNEARQKLRDCVVWKKVPYTRLARSSAFSSDATSDLLPTKLLWDGKESEAVYTICVRQTQVWEVCGGLK